MSFSTKCSDALLSIYKNVNRMGLLDSPVVQSAYISSYFTYKKYLEDSFAKLTKHYGSLFKGGHIIDVGANVGYTSYVFSKIIDDRYKIFAFEPEERNIRILKHVSNKYGFSSKIVIVEAAVGDSDGEIELWRNDAHNGDHRILTDELKKQLSHDIKIQKTPIVTIDNYLKKYNNDSPISFIKIDVQGYELAVCRGMSETLAAHPNAVIGFEYSPSILQSLGFIPEELLQFFQQRGYHFYYLNKNNQLERCGFDDDSSIAKKIKTGGYLDLLCSRRSLEQSKL